MIVLWILGGVLLVFGLVVLRGAPYVPTHRVGVRGALDMFDLPKGSTIVDLGSGDGVFLKAAAEQGYRVIGYELNPFLCVISYIRCWRYRSRVSVRWRDFWLSPLPPETDAVFVFLAGPYLRRLDAKLSKEKQGSKKMPVVSYGFEIPGRPKPDKKQRALLLYYY